MLVKTFLLALLSFIVKSNETTQGPNSTVTISTKTSKAVIANSGSTTELTTTEGTTVEPLNITAAICESNDTECANANVTTVSPIRNDTENNKTANDKNKTQPKSKIAAVTNICTCNLQVNICDINCCCDPDCSPSDKSIFGYCKIDENYYYDTRYCNYVQYIYINNTPIKWEVNQDGLFCVISSNLPDTYLLQKEEPINSLEDVNIENHFWNQDEDNIIEDESYVSSKNYGFGDTIIIVRDNSSIDKFRLPRNFVTSPCIFDEDIYYLKDVKHTCSQITIEEDNVKLNFSSYFQKIKIVGSPMLFNIKLKNNIYKNCPKNICLDIEPKICDQHFTNCSEIKNNTNINFHCSYDFKKNLNICQNAIKKVHYKFYHNGTNGLLRVEILGVLKNFSYHFGRGEFEFIQDFSVEFLWIDQIKNYSRILSGNPGYIAGKPILVGIKTNKDSAAFIERNSSRFLDNFLIFPTNVDGICVRNNTYNTPIEFEYNMITQCYIEKKLALKNNKNATNICRNIQKEIFDLWGLNMDIGNSLVVGLFGNANASNIQDWSSILYRIDPKDFLNTTQGNFSNNNQTVLCQNITTLLNVDVFYSRIDLKTLLNQNKILGVIFSFQNVHNQSFLLDKENNRSSIDLRFRLVSQVSFYDVTGEKAKKFVDPPSFDIRLPYDFFYPFIRVGNGVSLDMPNVVVIILFLYGCYLI